MSEKVREYWINDNAEGDGSFTASRTPWFGYVHVIEKSAHDQAIAERDKLAEFNKVLVGAIEQVLKKNPHLVNRNEAADMAVEFQIVLKNTLAKAKEMSK